MRALPISCLLCILGACNLAPRYSRPDVVMPTEWNELSDEGSTLANLSWWEAFGDPILNEYIQIALQNNKDLQVAVWRVKEYYSEYWIQRAPLFPEINLQGAALREQLPFQANFLPPGASSLTLIM